MGSEETVREIDALVVGTGMGGVMALRTLTADAGLDAIAIDKAPKVGGTWYWNRYPGALSDTQSFMYQLPYDRELFQRTDWRTRYVPGPEIRRYVEDAVDFWDLRSRIQLETSLLRAAFDEESARWHVVTDKGSSAPASSSPPPACSPGSTSPTSPASTGSRAASSTPPTGQRTSTSRACASA